MVSPGTEKNLRCLDLRMKNPLVVIKASAVRTIRIVRGE